MLHPPSREEAQRAYAYLIASFLERWPYNVGTPRDDRDFKTGYILALEDLAVQAFGLGREAAQMRVAEDYADYVASLG